MTDINELEALARKATPGPWMLDGMGEDEPEINYWAHRFIGTAEPNESGTHEIIATSEDGHGANAEYIAAADPPTVLALIADLRRAQECISKVQADCKSAQNQPGYGDYYRGVDSQAQAVLDILYWYDEGENDEPSA